MKRVKKLVALLCCTVLLCAAFPLTAFAKTGLTDYPSASLATPKITDYEWAMLGAAKRAFVQGKYFVIETTAALSSGKEYAELLYLSFPSEGGFRLQSKHEYQTEVEASHAGLFEPKTLRSIDMRTDSDGTKILHGSDGTNVRYTTSESGFRLQVCSAKDKKIVSITNRQISFAYKKDKVVRVLVELPLTGDGKEVIYGGGERFSRVNQVDSYQSLTNTGAANWQAFTYINVPLYHSNRGYSIWFNMVYPGEGDIGASSDKKYSIQFDGDKLDFFLWAGMPEENIKKYTALTGTSGVNEEWVYSFWAGACDTAWKEPNASENLERVLEGYYENYGFYPRSLGGEFSVAVDASMMQYQKKRGVRSLGWFMPESELLSSSLVKEDLNGMLPSPVFDASGNLTTFGYPYPYVASLYNKGIYKVLDTLWYDGSNPSFEQVIKNRWSQLWDWGSSGAMLDYGEKYSFYGISYNGLSGMEMHNLNAYYIAKAQYNQWTQRLGNDFVLYMRAGTAGSQYYVGNFLGDQEGTWKGYNSMIYAMINLGAAGFNNYGGDMFSNGGTKYAELTQDLRNRYLSLGTFSPYMRQHGNHLIMPWEEGEVLAQNFGTYYYFRENLVPSIMSAAIDANKNATPMVKGMMVAYPYQLSLSKVENQYLFCNDYLVCTVQQANVHALEVSLPYGETWYSLFTYDKYRGGQTVTVDAPTGIMPVFVRAGSVKPINLPDSQVLGTEMHPTEQIGNTEITNDYLDEEMPHASLLITPPDKERKTTVYVKDGTSENYQTYKYHTEEYTSAPVDNATFTVSNADGSPRRTVLALGVAASAVSYDGHTLERLDHIPDYYNEEYGYFVELSGLTTVYLPEGWKELKIVKGDAAYEKYALVDETIAIRAMVDDDPASSAEIAGTGNPVYFTLDYDAPQSIGRIVVRWGTAYLSSYDIEYSEDGDEWTLLEADAGQETADRGDHWWSMETAGVGEENTVEGGAGGFDVINFKPVNAQYLRLTPKKAGDTSSDRPEIYSFEVYPANGFAPIPVDDEDPEDYDDPDDDPWGIDEPDDPTDPDKSDDNKNAGGKKPVKRRIITTYFPTWAIILIVGGAVLLITGIILLLLLRRKKKKREAETALGAAEETPPGTSDA